MAELSDAELAAALRRINAWRRGDETIPMPEPAEFGRLLDLAAERLERKPGQKVCTRKSATSAKY